MTCVRWNAYLNTLRYKNCSPCHIKFLTTPRNCIQITFHQSTPHVTFGSHLPKNEKLSFKILHVSTVSFLYTHLGQFCAPPFSKLHVSYMFLIKYQKITPVYDDDKIVSTDS
ncbi:hypothetical protein RF11_13569 [Thelohanellus kitauei]|uniref:Uncharacterized protein n=1 Tax=Thelohanellus kitauei TaxID=669202 RepID=A0A0C2N9I4_THEKT|nr:hypothetical protein RF11_13569 [Thelohanellus kitauei]